MARITWAVLLTLVMVSCSDDTKPLPDRGTTPDQRVVDLAKADLPRTDGLRLDSCASTNPVKILFVVDTSGSMQFTDPQGKRKSAVQQLYDALKAGLNVSFGIIRYNSTVTVNGSSTSATFTRDGATLDASINGLAQAEVISDLQSALFTARVVIANDMKQATAVAKTRYAVILLTDGGTGPVCKAGCDNDSGPLGECTGGVCGTPSTPGKDGGPKDGGAALKSWCEVPRDQWCSTFNPPNCSAMTQWFPAMTAPCLEYNSEALLLAKAKELVELADPQKPGALQLHAVRLLDPATPSNILTLMGVDPTAAATFLGKVATQGGGSYLDLYTSGTLTTLPLQPLCL